MDDGDKKNWGAPHWIATAATLVATILGGVHVEDRYANDGKEAVFSRDEKRRLLSDMHELAGKMERLAIDLATVKVLLERARDARLEMKLRSHESRAMLNKRKMSQGG